MMNTKDMPYSVSHSHTLVDVVGEAGRLDETARALHNIELFERCSK